jgi:ABC-2 type transport system ATP-binding protein
VRDFVCEQRDHEGVSILYTSHNMDEVAQICDRVLFLDKGRIAAEGRPDELAASAAATRIRLRVERGLDDLLGQTSTRGLATLVANGTVEVEIDERHIAEFLGALARLDVRYTEIALDKPTLEDYFLKLARRKGSEVTEANSRKSAENTGPAANNGRERGTSS